MIDNLFGTVIDPTVLTVADEALASSSAHKPTIGEMTQEDFVHNLAGLMQVLLENFERGQQKEIYNVYGGGISGGGSVSNAVLVD